MTASSCLRWIAAVCLLALSGLADAADSTWIGTTDALWSTTTNWNPSAPTSADRAIFDGAGNGNTTMDLGAGQSTLGILFTSSNAAAYTIGSGGVNAQTLTLAATGTIAVDSTVVTDQLFNAAVLLGDATSGTYTFQNDDLNNLLTFSGSVAGGTGGTAGVKTLNLAGSGSTTISGAIANGGATSLSLTKSGTGTLTLSGVNAYTGATTVNGGILAITGTTNTGATNTTTVASTGTARMNISGNYTTGTFNIGTASGAVGAVYQTGGTTSVSAPASTFSMQIGQAGGAYGYYGMTSGSLSVNEVGVGGGSGGNSTGILDVSGGTFNVNGWITLSRSGNAAQNGVLNVSGSGTVIAVGSGGLQANWGGTNVVTVSGSGLLRHNANFAHVSSFSSGTGIVNLNGGTFEVNGGLAGGATLSLLNLNGGTLRSLANNTLVADSFSAAYVYGGGAIIDTNGFTSTVAEPLLAPGGSGVSSIAITGAGSGYIAPPLVTISGGGGTGATGFATIANGTISGITITNPGTGYTSAPTVTLSGGGGSGAAIGTVTTAANTSGGLTKNGAGTLTLGGINTYTGTTTVNAGTLQLGSATMVGSIGSTVGIVNSGAVVLYNAPTTTWTIPVSGAGSLAKYGPGSLTLSGSNTFTGPITLSGGVLAGDATTAATPLGNGSSVTATGFSTLRLTGAAGLSRAQVLGGLTVSSGALTVDVSNPGTSTTLDLSGTAGTATIARSGNATVNFTSGAGTFGTDAVVRTGASQTLSNGILGPWATVGGANWATVSSGTVLAFTGYTDINAQGSTLADGSTTNVRIAAAGSGAAVALGATTTSVNTLLQGTTTAVALDTASKTLRAAGIMVGSGQAGLTIGSAVGDGTLTAATAGGELILNNSSTNTLTVNAVVADNTSASVLTKTGSGTVVLAGVNAYTGNTVVNDGLLTIAGSRTGQGTLMIQGGTLRVAGTVTSGLPTVGSAAGSRGVLDVTGSLTTTTVDAGGGIGAAGVITQSGNLTTTGNTTLIGNVAGSYGAYLVTGGTATLGQTQIGASGNGVFVQTSGSVAAAAYPVIGRYAGGVGHATISGGAFRQTDSGAPRLIVGENGTGVLTISGSAAVESVGGIWVSLGGGVGTVNLLGGTVTTPFIQDNGGTSLLNLNGGTIRARAASATFLAVDTAVVQTGGATIDNNGFDLTIPNVLLAPAGSGVSSIPVSAGGSGYLAPPLVLLSGGGGSGATAIANVDANGAITGITITNPGTGYTSSPTVTLVGGGGTGATIGATSTAANVGGGLTKSGTGTLTLSGASTFTGNITIDSGTLVAANGGNGVGTTGALGNVTVARTITVNSGAALTYTAANVSGDATVTPAATLFVNQGASVNGATNAYNSLGPITLAGGTINTLGGSSATFGGFGLRGTVTTLASSAPSTLASLSGANSFYNLLASSGTFNVADGAATTDLLVSGPLLGSAGVALTKTGAGTMVLSAGNTLAGAMNVNAGVLSVTGTTTIGTNLTTVATSGTARMNVSGNYTTQNINIGGANGAVGAIFQTGGTTSITQAASMFNFQIGQAAGAYGYYGMTSGSLGVNELGLGGNNGGAGTIGILDVSGGTFDVNGFLAVNRHANASGAAVLNLSGSGTVISRAGSGLRSYGGTNIYNLTGSSTLRVSVGVVSALGGGDFNLAGGTFETNAGVTSAGRINLNGGTIRALANNTLIGTTTGGVTVYGGGVTIDTNGFNSTITPALVTASGTGVSAVAITAAGTGYIAPPLVTFSGGGGTGATGFATIANGTISGITIVNPGTGYTSAPTVTLSGGGGSGVTFGTVSMAANATTGGLTKNGAGTLTLSSANTYSGTTRVNSGTLALGNASSLGSSTLEMNGAGSLAFNALTSATVGGLSGAGPLVVTNTSGAAVALTVGANNQSTTYSGTLTGLGGLTKTGSGSLTLSGSNGYAGTTTVSSGSLLVSNANALGSAAGNLVAAAGTLDLGGNGITRSGTVSFTGGTVQSGTITNDTIAYDGQSGSVSVSLAGLASFTKTTTGTLTLSGVNTYSGTSGVNAGTLLLVNPASLYGGTTANWTAANVNVASGATLTLSVGASNFAAADVTTLLTNLGGLGGTVNNNGLRAGSVIGFDTSNAGGSFTVADSIRNSTGTGGGAIGVVKLGSGTLTLSASNAYTGATTVTNGVLNIASGAAINAGGGIVTVANGSSNATLTITGGAVTSATPMSIGGASSTAAGVVTVNSGVLTASAQIWVGSNNAAAGYGALLINGGTVTTSSWLAIGRGNAIGTADTRGLLQMTGGALNVGGGGNLSIGAFALSAAATSVMAISGGTAAAVNNVYVGENLSGILDVSGGRVQTGAGNSVRLREVNNAGTIGFLNLRGGTVATGAVSTAGTAGTSIFNFHGGTLEARQTNATFMQGLTQANIFAGGAAINTNGFNITIAQNLLAASGTGLSTIAVSGGTGYVAPPIVNISGGGGTGATALATVDANGNLTGITVTNPGTGYMSNPTITLSGGGGSGASVGAITTAANTSGGLTKTGAGVLTLSGSNSFSGDTRVGAGGLTVANANALQNSTLDMNAADSSTVSFSQNSTLGGLSGSRNLDMGTRTLTIGGNGQSTTYSGGLSNGAVTKLGSGTLTLSGSNGYTGATAVDAGVLRIGAGGAAGSLASSSISVASGALVAFNRTDNYGGAISSVISGSGGVRVDSGFLALAGLNTYTGATDVLAGGTLAVNGSLANASLTVASGATLMGSGTIAGLTTIAGLHRPGNSPGVETFTNLTYNAGASVQWELWGNTASNSPTAFDQIVVNGDLTFAGATMLDLVFTGSAGPSSFSAVSWSNAFWGSNQEWLLYDVAGSLATANNLTLNVTNWQDSTGAFFQTARPNASFSVEQRASDVYIVYAVPEPGTLVLAGVGVAAVVALRCRRRRAAA